MNNWYWLPLYFMVVPEQEEEKLKELKIKDIPMQSSPTGAKAVSARAWKKLKD